MNKIFQQLPSWLVAITVALIPLCSYDYLIDPKLTSRHLLISVLTLILILFSLFNARKLTVYKNWLYWCLPFFFLFISYFSSSFFSLNVGEAYFWIGKIAVYFSLFTVLLLLRFQDMLHVRKIAVAIMISVFVGLLLFLFEANEKQLLKTTTLIDKNLYSLSSPFGHKNLYASYLVLCIPFLGYLFVKSRKIKRFWYVFVLILALGLIMVLQAKASILGLIIAGIFLLPVVLFIIRKQNKKRFRIILIGGGVLLITSLLTIFLFQDHFALLFQTASVKERLLVWQNTASMIQEFPMTGVGGGNWQIYFPKYGLNSFHEINEQIHLGYQTFQRPHNDFLWVFSEAGVLGILAFVSIFLSGLIGVYRSFHQSNNYQEKIIPLLFGLGIIAYAIISVFDFPLERSEHVFIFILLLVFSIPLTKSSKKRLKTSSLLGIFISLFIISGYSVYNTSIRIQQEKEHLKVLVAHRRGEWNAMLNVQNESNRHFYEIDNFSIPREWYRGVAHFTLGNIEKSKKAFENAYEQSPYQVHVINNLAGVYQNQGDHKKAIKFYDEALRIASYHPEILLNKSVALFNQKKIDAAFDNLLKLEYKKEHPANYHHAMRIIFNRYIKKLKQDHPDKYPLKSLNNIEQSDSLKVVFLFEYQINKKSKKELLNTFTMDLK